MFTDYAPLFEFLQKQDTEVYLVGGAVRDLLLGCSSHDLDFVVLGDAPQMARKTANYLCGAYYLMDDKRGIARVLVDNETSPQLILDFSNARGNTLESDLRARDFTINAIALDLHTRKIVDPLEGSRHLREKILIVCNPESFLQDPVRVLRAFRFSLYLNLRLGTETKALLYQAIPQLATISGERQRDELFRLFSGGKAGAALRLLQHAGVMKIVIPELDTIMQTRGDVENTDEFMEIVIKTLQNVDMILDFIAGKRELMPETLYSNLIFLYLGQHRLNLSDHLQRRLTAERSLRGLICLTGMFFPFFTEMPFQSEHVPFEPSQDDFLQSKSEFLRPKKDLVTPQINLLIKRWKYLALSKAEILHSTKIISHANCLFDLVEHARQVTEITNGNNSSKPIIDKRQIYRYFRSCGEAGIDICLLSLALFGARSERDIDQHEYIQLLQAINDLFNSYWEANINLINPQPIINGQDVIRELRIQPGVKVGQILELIKEEQAAGTIQNHDQALAFVRKLIHNE